jgi:hypothetical protein
MSENFRHAEAYCLMTYRTQDGAEEEVIWNSRDGVTPFSITLRSGREALHVNWASDRRVVDHQPAPGSRIFVDLTEASAMRHARANAERWFNDPGMGEMARERYGTVENMAAELAQDYMSHPGAPDLVEVPHA